MPVTKRSALSALALAGLIAAGVIVARAAVPNDTYVELWAAEDASQLDPALAYDAGSGAILENVYETLVTYKGGDLKTLQPLLATAWTTSADKRTYTFTLRQNVKFHSGSVMTCNDAAYSLRRVLVTNNPESAGWFYADALLGTRENAKDDKSITWAKISSAVQCNASGQLVLRTVKFDPAFIAKLAYTASSVMEQKWVVANGGWSGAESDWQAWAGKKLEDGFPNKNTNGTGAYTLTSLKPDSGLFTAFDGYWGGAPKIKKVLGQKVDTEDGRILAMKNGDADSIGVRRVLFDQLKVPNVQIIDDLPTIASDFIVMNYNIKDKAQLGSGKLDGKGIPANFFSDLNVRKCFAYSYDVKTIIKELLQGKGYQPTMALPRDFLGYDPTVPVPAFNLEAAKKACAAAWGGNVAKNGFVVRAEYAGARIPTTFQMLQTNLAKLNPKYKLVPQRIQSSETIKWQDGKGAVFISGWLPDYLDSDNYMYSIYHSKGYFSTYTGFKDTQIDTWIDQARSTDDTKKREALYKQIGRRAAALQPLVLIAESPNYAILSSATKGYKENYNPMLSSLVRWKDLSK
jgi:peptide/nickel transport system substrate-binding protein